jgi:hypothetical protein
MVPGSGPGAKRGLSQPSPVYCAVRVEDPGTKMTHHFLVDRLTGLNELVSDIIGADQMYAECDKHLTYYRFASRNTAGEADFQQARLDELRLTISAERSERRLLFLHRTS